MCFYAESDVSHWILRAEYKKYLVAHAGLPCLSVTNAALTAVQICKQDISLVNESDAWQSETAVVPGQWCEALTKLFIQAPIFLHQGHMSVHLTHTSLSSLCDSSARVVSALQTNYTLPGHYPGCYHAASVQGQQQWSASGLACWVSVP